MLIYDPKISDAAMLRLLQERAKAGVEIKVIGSMAGRAQFDVHKLAGQRLHTRTIVRDPDVKETMKKVVKKAVKEAVKEAVQDAQDAQDVKGAGSQA